MSDTEEQSPPAQQYPVVNVQFTQAGALVQVQLGPLTGFFQALPPAVMDDITRRWLAHKKEMETRQRNELAVIRHLNSKEEIHGR